VQWPPNGHIEDVPEEPKKYSNEGNPDPDLDPDPKPKPKSDHKPKHNKGNLIKNWYKAINSLTKSVHKDPSKSKAKHRDPNTFNGSDLKKKLGGFLLQCKLNFQSKPKSFCTEQSKVNHTLSFLKGTTLDYFGLYLTNDPVNEPAWLNNSECYFLKNS